MSSQCIKGLACMEYEPVNLTHQKLLEERFKKMEMELSEYTFANVYLFRQVHHYELVFNRDIYIKGVARDKSYYLMPTTKPEEINFTDLTECLEGLNFIFPIPENWKHYFPENQFNSVYLEEESDYLYDVNKMKTYSGRNLSGRRNLLKQFQELYPDHHTVSLNSQSISGALEVLEGWRTAIQKEDSQTDYNECREALFLMEKLGLNGQLTWIDSKPAAFVLGEELNTTTYVIHFAKALTQFKGIYQYIYQAHANLLDSKYQFINLEQDMGAEEMRHAKRAYIPDQLISKFRITPK